MCSLGANSHRMIWLGVVHVFHCRAPEIFMMMLVSREAICFSRTSGHNFTECCRKAEVWPIKRYSVVSAIPLRSPGRSEMILAITCYLHRSTSQQCCLLFIRPCVIPRSPFFPTVACLAFVAEQVHQHNLQEEMLPLLSSDEALIRPDTP